MFSLFFIFYSFIFLLLSFFFFIFVIIFLVIQYMIKNLADLLEAKKKAYPHNGSQAFSDPLKNECYW